MTDENPWPWLDLGETCTTCGMPLVCRPSSHIGQIRVTGCERMDFKPRGECGLNLRVRRCVPRNYDLWGTEKRYHAKRREIEGKEDGCRETQENA